MNRKSTFLWYTDNTLAARPVGANKTTFLPTDHKLLISELTRLFYLYQHNL